MMKEFLELTHDTIMAENTTIDTSNFTMLQTSDSQWTDLQRIILAIILGVILTVAVFGNGIILVIFCVKKSMHTKTNLFITNLALGDFLNAILVMPISLVTMIKGHWMFDDVVCTLNGTTVLVFFTLSIHTLMFISIERYIVITRPGKRIMTKTKIYIMIAVAWLWSLLYGVLGGFVISHFVYKEGTTQCGPTYPHSNPEYVFAAVVLFSYILPLAVMTFTYVCIFREIRNHLNRLATTTTMDHDVIISQKRRTSVTIFMALILFVVLWLPLAVYIPYVTVVSHHEEKIPHIINPIVYWCGFLNSACNPILFGFRIPAIRLTIKKCFYKLCRIKYNPDQVLNSSGQIIRTPRSTPLGTPLLQRLNALQKTTNEQTESHLATADTKTTRF